MSQRITKSVFMAAVAGCMVFLQSSSLMAQNYAGVWKKSSFKHHVYVFDAAEWSKFVGFWKDYSNQGYRLKDLETRIIQGVPVFNGVFEKSGGRYALYRFAGWSNFTKKWKELADDGMRLVDIETYKYGGQQYFVGVWRAGNDGYALYCLNGFDALAQKRVELASQGKRLIDVESFVENGKQLYVGVWRSGNGGHALYQYSSWDSFRAKRSELTSGGLRLVDYEKFKTASGQTKYLGVWRAGQYSETFYSNISWEDFVTKTFAYEQQQRYIVDFDFMK